ncbi:hypothetical protein ACHAXR_004901 [Thalassiosira sp. AJA248-18]
MRLSQFNVKQCHGAFLPLLVINRSTPRAVVHGPIQYGCMNIFKHCALQDEWGLHFLIQTLQWDKITANDVVTVLDSYQLATGFVEAVLFNPGNPNPVSIEDAWQPKLQRIGDDSIMEVFAACTKIKPKERILVNEFRIWLKVICISDLADLDGEWQAIPAPQYKWPNQPIPSDAYSASFRRCLRLIFCTTASPQQQRGRYHLDEPLGRWFAHPRHVLHTCYRLRTIYTSATKLAAINALLCPQKTSSASTKRRSTNPHCHLIRSKPQRHQMGKYGGHDI